MPISSNTRRPHVMSAPRVAQDHQAAFNRALALAQAGKLDEFAAVAFGLPDLNRIDAPAPVARHRPMTAQDAYAAYLVSGERAEAAAQASKLFPNMNRLDGGR
jgi:hypothetical protein